MEFYEGSRPNVAQKHGFNSQRDGILLRIALDFVQPHIVSIPNGMEFYLWKPRKESVVKSVSIPNGMEFYSTNFAIFLGRKC